MCSHWASLQLKEANDEYTRRIKFLARTVVASVMASLVVAWPATPASAGLLDLTCGGTDTVQYSPPLTSTPQTVTTTATSIYGPCVSLSHPSVNSGIRQNTSTGTRDCITLLKAGTSNDTITWNTGQTSHVTANRVTNVVGAMLVITYTGVVTSGLFAGDSFVQILTGPATDITLCTLGLGTVSSIYSVVALEITSV